ncbi:hypothetical protein HNR32_000064 [Pectinatus brassicae]|uniref:Uncharacterized protein n=1 Tax=Pectinatus brassicae TaxID=862415 RepID=A0A840UQ59_9FIRM|nr:hypothetical protein [Pectinatus brassicae]
MKLLLLIVIGLFLLSLASKTKLKQHLVNTIAMDIFSFALTLLLQLYLFFEYWQ